MAKSGEQFQTVRTEGALLPPDILKAISSLKVDGATAAEYHLAPGTKPNEAIAHSWSVLEKHWKAFQEVRAQLDPSKTGTDITNQHWLLPLFEELKYGRLTTSRGPEIDGRSYPIERFYARQPIHLIGCNLPLDRRTSGARGAAISSPHSMMQEFLNRSPDSMWGFLSNGLVLRVLRDNVSLSRQAYVEFNLEAMMEGKAYADFALLWLLCHQSRIEAENPSECWLEKWSQLARDLGTRVLSELREGVTNAIAALGRGFLAHPRNDRLREKLQSGPLNRQEFYRQLLRVVYRLLFLFVAEDRKLLHPPGAATAACELYDTYYSTRRLRDLADSIRGSKHADLWHSLSLVFQRLHQADGCAELGLIGLGSFLWNPANTADLLGPRQTTNEADAVLITNDDLLTAVRALAYVEQNRVRRAVDYRNLGSEELGSVYESLLELHPILNVQARTFELTVAGGNERKTTGSYYTPDSLVQCLLDSALDPVVTARLQGLRGQEAEAALLSIKVCDPACGSGHFLIAAAHRLARHLARIRTGESEPAPDDHQHALRNVIGRCIYGVDMNPMAVELCKVSLWMEAIEPGRPLNFLDHHIQCGNSLIGTTPSLLAAGIPDEAFSEIEGDDKEVVKGLKRDNRRERQDFARGYRDFHFSYSLGDLPAEFARLSSQNDDTVADVVDKERRHADLLSGTSYQNAQLVADLWCAAFVWLKTSSLGGQCPTERLFRNAQSSPHTLTPEVREEILQLRKHYKFFHWHLAFPDVFRLPGESEGAENAACGWSGGFDLVLGNPPWDTMSPDAKEFFSSYDPQVRFQDRDGQKQIIATLLEDAEVSRKWAEYCRDLYALVHFIKQSGRYVLFAPGNLGKGDFNVYRMFVESALSLTRPAGWAAQLVPEGLYNGANCMAIREALYERCLLSCMYGFENANEVWFGDVDTRMKFCMYAACIGGSTESFQAAFNVRSKLQLSEVRSGRSLNIPLRLVREFSPDALAIMELGNQLDIDIAARMYRWPAFGDESAGPPIRTYMAEVHMGADRELFASDSAGIPLYEGRMVDQYDYRAKGYRSGRGRAADWIDLAFTSPGKSIQPQWYISRENIPEKCRVRIGRYRIGFCDVASPTNERSLVAAIIPPSTICGDKVPTIVFENTESTWALLTWISVANSYSMDFIARKKVSLKMSYTVLDSLPFPRLTQNDPRTQELVVRSARLSCTGREMTPLWNQIAADGWVAATTAPDEIPGELVEQNRLQLRAEIDAIVARDLFELTRAELEYVLSTFPVQQRYQEAEFGEFRSRRLILEAFDTLPRPNVVGRN